MSTGNVGGTGGAGGVNPNPPSGADLQGPPPSRPFESVMRDKSPSRPKDKVEEKKDDGKTEKKGDEAKGTTADAKRPKTLEEFRAMRAKEKGSEGETTDEDLAARGLPNPATQKPLDVRRPIEARSELRVEGAALSKDAVEKIVDRVRIGTNRAGATEMQFDCKGDVLGGLGMKISTIDGKVYATFIADSPGVKEMLDKNVGELGKALRDRGLAIGELKVDLRRGDTPDQDARDRNESAWAEQDEN